MAITKRVVIQDVAVEADGQLAVYEVIEYWEGGVINGTLEVTGPRKRRQIDVGDDVAADDALIKDIVNGNLHSAARKDTRDAIKAAKAAVEAEQLAKDAFPFGEEEVGA
jgi:hypothetical protein